MSEKAAANSKVVVKIVHQEFAESVMHSNTLQHGGTLQGPSRLWANLYYYICYNSISLEQKRILKEKKMTKIDFANKKWQIATNYGHRRLGEASQMSHNVNTVANHNLNVGVTTY